MKNYQGLKNLCTIWVLLAVIVSSFIGIAGGIDLLRGNLIGLAYIIATIFIVLFAQTLSEIIGLFIEATVYLRRIAELTHSAIESETPRSPQAGIRKLPKV